jgi:molybdopterin-containing oxidoreductase family membrane subunit
VLRDRGRSGVFTGWGRGWRGTPKRWSVLTTGLILLGAFYVALYAYVHIFMVADMAMSLVPGWKSAIYPAYHGVSGIQAGFATTLLTIAALRKWGGLRGYIQLAQFWGLAKLLLALSLLFFYFSWDEFATYWYGRTPEEMILIHLLMFGPYIWLYLPGFFMNFVLPFLLLIWNPIRVSIGGPPRVAAIVLLGNFIDRIRIYVASWSVAGPVDVHLDQATLPGFQLPTILDLLIVVGAISGVLLLYLLALRRFPVISLWEYKQADLLTIEKPYVKGHVAVIAKPN